MEAEPVARGLVPIWELLLDGDPKWLEQGQLGALLVHEEPILKLPLQEQEAELWQLQEEQ